MVIIVSCSPQSGPVILFYKTLHIAYRPNMELIGFVMTKPSSCYTTRDSARGFSVHGCQLPSQGHEETENV